MNRKEITLSSPIEEKIAWAQCCYEAFGERLLKDKRIADLLERLKTAAAASRSEMALTGIVDVCRRCDLEEGSCCGAGIENRYDAWLLLINLLLGVHLPERRRRKKDCYLLGEHGCLLTVRHVICINYLCRKVSDQIPPTTIVGLREKEGEEVNILFTLHETMKKALRQWSKG